MVSLGADIAANLPFLREQAASRFTETLDFYTTVETSDPETHDVVTVETKIGRNIQGRVKFSNVQGRDAESGSQFPIVSRLEVHVAAGAVSARADVFVRVKGSDADPGLVGRVFRVTEPAPGGQVTAWRYPVEEVT